VWSAHRQATRLEHLRQVPGFRGCSTKQLRLVARLSDELTVPCGTVLLREGSAGREAFLILEGTVAETRGGDLVASLGTGDIFGELAALDPGPRDATITATSELKVLVVGPRELSSLIQEVPSFSTWMLTKLARRNRPVPAGVSAFRRPTPDGVRHRVPTLAVNA
jgi:CRP/FNR family transcriptional regulator, cyclic AMP receptor protein